MITTSDSGRIYLVRQMKCEELVKCIAKYLVLRGGGKGKRSKSENKNTELVKGEQGKKKEGKEGVQSD